MPFRLCKHLPALLVLACISCIAHSQEMQSSGTSAQNTQQERYQVADSESDLLESFFNQFPKTLAEINDELKINITNYGVSKIYFDTPQLDLQNKGLLLYFQKDDIKTYDQSINNVFLGNTDGTTSKYETKKYNRKISREDKHPLLGLIKRSEREIFNERLKQTGIDDLLSLKKTVTVHRQGKVINLYYKGYQLNLVIHDRVNTRFLGRDHASNYLSIPQVNSAEIDNNDDIQLLLTIRGILVQTIRQNFATLEPVDNFMDINPYQTVSAEIPMMPLIVENTLTYKLFQAALFLVFLGIIALALRKLPAGKHFSHKHTVYMGKHKKH